MNWTDKQRDRMLVQRDRELDLCEKQVQINEAALRLWGETTKRVADILHRVEALEAKVP